MNVIITCNELFPFYEVNENTFNELAVNVRAVPVEDVRRWNAAMKEFWAVQKEMKSHNDKTTV